MINNLKFVLRQVFFLNSGILRIQRHDILFEQFFQIQFNSSYPENLEREHRRRVCVICMCWGIEGEERQALSRGWKFTGLEGEKGFANIDSDEVYNDA